MQIRQENFVSAWPAIWPTKRLIGHRDESIRCFLTKRSYNETLKKKHREYTAPMHDRQDHFCSIYCPKPEIHSLVTLAGINGGIVINDLS